MEARKFLATLVLLLGALAFVAVGCGGDDDEGEPEEPAATEEAPEEEETEDISFDLRVGTLVSFTGDLAPFGEPIDTAAKIAAEIANEAAESAGIDASVEVVASEDDQTDATAGVEGATKLVQTDEVAVIVGALGSAITIPVAESVTIPNEVIQISPASTSPAITELADDGYIWRTAPSDALQGVVLAQAIGNELGSDVTINVGTRNDAYGTALAGVFEEAWQEGGGTIGASVQWNAEAATLDSEAQQLAAGNPDGWVIIDFPETWAKIGPSLVRTGNWDPTTTFVTDGLRDATLPEQVGEEATEGMRGSAPVPPEGSDAAAAFQTAWDERSGGVERQTFDAQAFDAVILAFLAAVAANSSEPADMKEHMADVSGGGTQYTFEQLADAITAIMNGEDVDYVGTSGPIDWDDNGDPSAATYELWQFEGGEITAIETFDVET
ncbi:MAG TPA: ABC transporter substrate-binding protein [Gaiellaceae bacterium]|nr:ABC transporter substrate-binding protein [Gaiellaceae bacterium]